MTVAIVHLTFSGYAKKKKKEKSGVRKLAVLTFSHKKIRQTTKTFTCLGERKKGRKSKEKTKKRCEEGGILNFPFDDKKNNNNKI